MIDCTQALRSVCMGFSDALETDARSALNITAFISE